MIPGKLPANRSGRAVFGSYRQPQANCYTLIYFLLGKETLAPESNMVLLNQLDEDSHKSARWGLFNPHGIGPFDHNPDDDITPLENQMTYNMQKLPAKLLLQGVYTLIGLYKTYLSNLYNLF